MATVSNLRTAVVSGVRRREAAVVTLTVIGRGNADDDMLRRTETDRLILDELSQLNYIASCVVGVESKQENKMVEFHCKCAACPLLVTVM